MYVWAPSCAILEHLVEELAVFATLGATFSGLVDRRLRRPGVLDLLGQVKQFVAQTDFLQMQNVEGLNDRIHLLGVHRNQAVSYELLIIFQLLLFFLDLEVDDLTISLLERLLVSLHRGSIFELA